MLFIKSTHFIHYLYVIIAYIYISDTKYKNYYDKKGLSYFLDSNLKNEKK